MNSSSSRLLLPLLILLFAAGLRVYQIKSFAPTPDEMFTITLTRLDRADRLAMTASDCHPPLYTELQAAWNNALQGALGRPPGLLSMRLFPAGLGVLSVALLLFAGGRLLGWREGCWLGAFWAVCPVAIGYSQTLRSYSLCILLLLGCVFAFVALERAGSARGRWQGAAALAACGTGLLYTHLLGGVFLAGIGLVWFWERGRRPDRLKPVAWLRGTAAFGAIGLAFLPYVFALPNKFKYYQGHGNQDVPWPGLADIFHAPFFAYPFGDPNLGGWLRGALMLAAPACMVLAGLRWHGRFARNSASRASRPCHENPPVRWLLPRLGFVFGFAFVATWFPSWRHAMVLFYPAASLLAALAVAGLALYLPGRAAGGRRAAVPAWIFLLAMFAVSFARPLAPQKSNYLWENWRRALPAQLWPVADGDPASGTDPAPRVVYPDFWAGVIPPERGAPPLVPFSTWLGDARSAKQAAILIEPAAQMRGFTAGESGHLEYCLLVARQASGYPPAASHDAQVLDAHTSVLGPLKPEMFSHESERLRGALPQKEALATCTRVITAPDLTHAARGFYSIEHDNDFHFWRWTQGDRCHLLLPGPLNKGPAEVILCMDRPLPYPKAIVKWPWRVLGDGGRELAHGELEFPTGGPQLLRLPVKLEWTENELEIELHPSPWQPTAIAPQNQDLRLLGGRFFWAGVRGMK